MRQEFFLDLEKIYEMLEVRADRINDYYNLDSHREFFDNLLNDLNIRVDDEARLALATRLISLRDDALLQVLKQQEFSNQQIVDIKERVYKFVRDFYLKEHRAFLDEIEKRELLTPFYRIYLSEIHKVGTVMSRWQSSWTKDILIDTNENLKREFGDDVKVMEFLEQNSLFDRGHSGEIADRSYSVLKRDEDGYKSVSYFDAFDEVKDVVLALKSMRVTLLPFDDEVFEKKEAILKYIDSLVLAFSEKDTNALVSKWADVDRAWMDIDIPLQLAHPLEYYEDHYRKAVALEFDVRIQNPKIKNSRAVNIEKMYLSLFDSLNMPEANSTIEQSLDNIKKVQLHIGKMMLFYASEFNGLFSAQVVPNDEIVSKEFGKKIFAFPDSILQSSRAKPLMKLPRVVFGDEFVESERKFLFNEDEAWHKIYDITTIGHEYGHILWVDSESETIMNKTGDYKNIEEFKATTGGLVSFFMNEEDNLWQEVLKDTLKRAVGLIAWMEVGEVKPYYCEGLIHLSILFDSKVLDFKDSKLSVDISKDAYERAKELYIEVYCDLAKHYLNKVDASEFLFKFVEKGELNYLPKDKKIASFVDYYYNLYKEIGRELDSDSKERYK